MLGSTIVDGKGCRFVACVACRASLYRVWIHSLAVTISDMAMRSQAHADEPSVDRGRDRTTLPLTWKPLQWSTFVSVSVGHFCKLCRFAPKVFDRFVNKQKRPFFCPKGVFFLLTTPLMGDALLFLWLKHNGMFLPFISVRRQLFIVRRFGDFRLL